jgi:hypothetical protein
MGVMGGGVVMWWWCLEVIRGGGMEFGCLGMMR